MNPSIIYIYIYICIIKCNLHALYRYVILMKQNCTAQGSPSPLGLWISTLQRGPWSRPLCPKLGRKPAEAMGLGSRPLCLTQGPLGMRSWTVHFTIHNQRLAWPTQSSRERDCSGILCLSCSVLPWGISLLNVLFKMGTNSKVTIPTSN